MQESPLNDELHAQAPASGSTELRDAVPRDTAPQDPTFVEEAAHLAATYAKLEELRDQLSAELESGHAGAAKDLKDLSDEVRVDFGGADETLETLAAIETLNAVIDAYNQYHDFSVDKLRRILLLLQRPYFAKVRLQMRAGRPPRDIYIGPAGITDEKRNPLIVDWRSPVAETYYNQQMGPTSYLVDGKERKVTLELRRQFDIVRNQLKGYFDTTVAIEDAMLLDTLRRHHTQKLQDITATIQREQNAVVRHEDVDALIVNGIAGSGKTSVLLQRIAYLFYQQRETLSPDQVALFTPNSLFQHYIDQVLPTLGESNPQLLTWSSFMAGLGLSERAGGESESADSLAQLAAALPDLTLTLDDFTDVRGIDGTVLLKAAQAERAWGKFSKFPAGPKRSTLTKEELHGRLEQRLSTLAKKEAWQERLLSLTLEEQIEIFGEIIQPETDEQTEALTRRWLAQYFSAAHDQIDQARWLRIDRIGMRLLNAPTLSAATWLELYLLLTGAGDKNVRYVIIDEVQDYTKTQLTVLTHYFSRAHFLLLGDEHQAIRPNTATFSEIRSIFEAAGKPPVECRLTTSYRSSPEITELFASLLDTSERITLSSVHRPGTAPVLATFENTADYLAALAREAQAASEREGLTAIIVADKSRVHWLGNQLNGLLNNNPVRTIGKGDSLPKDGVVLLDLALAKGLEFDEVIVADAQEQVYPANELSQRRLYTAISRAMHRVTIFSQGPMTPLLSNAPFLSAN